MIDRLNTISNLKTDNDENQNTLIQSLKIGRISVEFRMNQVNVAIICEPCDVGTRLHWDDVKKCLFYVDVPNSLIYKYQPTDKTLTKAKVGEDALAFAFPVKNQENLFIAGLGRKFVHFNWDGESEAVDNLQEIGEIDNEGELIKNRLNGGKVDPAGRLWAGSMGPTGPDGDTLPDRGSLFSVNRGKIRKHLSNIGISNGLAWNVDEKKMYYIDTLFPGIYQFDYDHANGDISNQEIIFKFERNVKGLPDGLTIDQDGNLWVTMIYGSQILKVDPRNRKLLQTIQMPTTQITSLCFGDEDLQTLYVTTARMIVREQKPEYPAGCVLV